LYDDSLSLDEEDVVRKKLKLSWLKERNQRDEELKKDNYGRIDERDEERDQEREKIKREVET
jgi:hypothetical protein